MFHNTVPYRKIQLTEMFGGSSDESSAEVEVCIKQNCLILTQDPNSTSQAHLTT